MTSIGVRELKQSASAVLARVRENGEEVEVTYRGRVIARIVPVRAPARGRSRKPSAAWLTLDDLAGQIGAAVNQASQPSHSDDWRRDL
jgi:prevent-host-death family protein